MACGRLVHDLLCFVSGWLSAIIAVAGTLLGSLLTYVFQQRSAARAFSELLRAERLAAYSGLVTALSEYNTAQLAWYGGRAADPGSPETAAAAAETYRLRGSARAALSLVDLVAPNKALVAAAAAAFDPGRAVSRAEGQADLAAKFDAANTAIGVFVAMAAAEVQAAPAVAPTRLRRRT